MIVQEITKLNGGYIRACKWCKESFVTDHFNTDYCSNNCLKTRAKIVKQTAASTHSIHQRMKKMVSDTDKLEKTMERLGRKLDKYYDRYEALNIVMRDKLEDYKQFINITEGI